MDVYALDRDFNVIAIGIPYVNLQWTRRYYEPGDFALQVDMASYDQAWAYIGAVGRSELGMVQKVLGQGSTSMTVVVSGFFCEKMLDDKTCYPRYIGDASKTETAVRSIFDKYKDDLPIALAAPNSPLLGDRTQSDFSDDQLGTKLYSILQTRGMSYRVAYDYVSNALSFGVWKGLNRTQSQGENPYHTFSLEFGNISSRVVNLDDSDFKNYAIVPIQEDESGKETRTLYVDLSNGGYKREIVFPYRSYQLEEGQTQEDFEGAIIQEATERLLTFQKVEEVDIEVLGDTGYMVDYDLGDVCDVVLSDIGIQMEARIVEVMEVFKAEGGHSVTVGLGNKRISNMRRVVSSL